MAFRIVPVAAVAMMVAGLAALPAAAQSVRVLGDHNAWSAYATRERVGQICFVRSQATSTKPSLEGLGGAYFYITHRPDRGIRSEISLIVGFQFAPGRPATLSVDGQSFDLFTEGDGAWLADSGQADAVVEAIRAGSSMVVESTTLSGQTVRQTFSLSGATAATNDIEDAC